MEIGDPECYLMVVGAYAPAGPLDETRSVAIPDAPARGATLVRVATVGSGLAALALRTEFETRASRKASAAERVYQVVDMEEAGGACEDWDHGIVTLVSPWNWSAAVDSVRRAMRRNRRLRTLASSAAASSLRVVLDLFDLGVRAFVPASTTVEGWADIIEFISPRPDIGPHDGTDRLLASLWGQDRLILDQFSELGGRDRDILTLYLQGKTRVQIAAELGIAGGNVNHRLRLMRERYDRL